MEDYSLSIFDYHDPIWECMGCLDTAPREEAIEAGWRFTDAAWCPNCKWLA